jgi:hypothetical protein
VAIDAEGNAWVAGFTKSADFPVTSYARQKRYGGGGDAFLVKLSPIGSVLFSTFIGGPKSDFGKAIAIIANQPVIGGTSDEDAFVQRGHRHVRPSAARAKKNSLETHITKDGSMWGIAVDKRGRVFIAGQPDSRDLPHANRGYQKVNRGGVDAFIAQIGGPTTYFGDSKKDEAGYDGQKSQSVRTAMSGSPVSLTQRTSTLKGPTAVATVTNSLPGSHRRWTTGSLPRTQAVREGN